MKRAKLLEVIKTAPQLGRGTLCKRKGEYCILGYLLHLAGVPDKVLMRRGAPTAEQYQLIYDKFGLTSNEANGLMGTNDSHEVDERREALLNFIRFEGKED